MADLSHIPVLVPAHVEDAADLPMSVLDSASNHIGADIVAAAQGNPPEKRYAAWAELAYQWARLSGVDKPKRETYREYTVSEITHALRWDVEEEPDPTPPSGDSSSDSSESQSPASSAASPTTSAA